MSKHIVGGLVVTPDGTFQADVTADGETILAIGRDLTTPEGAEVIHASGCYVLPGCVDMHTHLEAPHNDLDESAADTFTCDDFRAGTLAAAVGGTTSIVDFATQGEGDSLNDTLAAWQQRLTDKPPAVDVGLHMIVTDMNYSGADSELAGLPARGVPSFKLFLAYKESPLWVDDDTMFRVAQVAAEVGATVMVHAENGSAIQTLQMQALSRGESDAINHALTRPALTESEAVGRAIDLCQIAGARVYFMHISCQESVEVIARARAKGWDVHAETCPQYLAFSEEVLRRPPAEAAKYVVTPPPRTEADQEALWRALKAGILEIVSTDHCPYSTAQKARAENFLEIPNGAPGIEDRLEVIHQLGVRMGRISLEEMVDLLATRPARLFGLDRKGVLAPNADADIVIFDPTRSRVISAKDQVSRCDYTLYEGMSVTGCVRDVIFRGETIVKDRKLVGAPDRGRFVERSSWRGEVTSARRPESAVV